MNAAVFHVLYLWQGVYDLTGSLMPQGVYAGSDAIMDSCLELFLRPARINCEKTIVTVRLTRLNAIHVHMQNPYRPLCNHRNSNPSPPITPVLMSLLLFARNSSVTALWTSCFSLRVAPTRPALLGYVRLIVLLRACRRKLGLDADGFAVKIGKNANGIRARNTATPPMRELLPPTPSTANIWSVHSGAETPYADFATVFAATALATHMK